MGGGNGQEPTSVDPPGLSGSIAMERGKGSARRIRAARSRRGFSLLEVCVSMSMMAVLLLAVAGASGTNLRAMGGAERTSRATRFFESTLEGIGTQPFENLLGMNGDRYFDETNAGDSNFRLDLDVFPVDVGVVQVRAILRDLRNGRELGRVNTLRSQR